MTDHADLADQRRFELDQDAWDEFVAMLDAPVKPDPKLRALLTGPSRLEQQVLPRTSRVRRFLRHVCIDCLPGCLLVHAFLHLAGVA